MFFAKVDQQGKVEVAFMGSGVDPDGLTEIREADYVRIRSGGTFQIVDGEVVEQPPETIALTVLRARQLAAINTERDRREESGFPYRGMLLDSNPRSVQRITTAVLAAQVALSTGQPYSIDWTCADNSTLSLDAAGVIGMPVALAQHAAELHAHARTLKMTVEAAGSEAELDTIDIHAGWPGGEA